MDTNPLQIGQPLPELNVQTSDGKATTVQAHLGRQKTLLYFLHGTWCPECVGQYHLLERYRPAIALAGADIVVITGDDLEALNTFLASTLPPLQYAVLTDPTRTVAQRVGVGGDTLAIIADGQGAVRWLARWPDHDEEPNYETFVAALRQV
jgi:peroxiredoxin